MIIVTIKFATIFYCLILYVVYNCCIFELNPRISFVKFDYRFGGDGKIGGSPRCLIAIPKVDKSIPFLCHIISLPLLYIKLFSHQKQPVQTLTLISCPILQSF